MILHWKKQPELLYKQKSLSVKQFSALAQMGDLKEHHLHFFHLNVLLLEQRITKISSQQQFQSSQRAKICSCKPQKIANLQNRTLDRKIFMLHGTWKARWSMVNWMWQTYWWNGNKKQVPVIFCINMSLVYRCCYFFFWRWYSHTILPIKFDICHFSYQTVLVDIYINTSLSDLSNLSDW